MKAMTLRLPDDVYERLRQDAFDQRVSMTSLVLNALAGGGLSVEQTGADALTADMLIYGYGDHKRVNPPSGLCSCGHDEGLGKQFSTHIVNEFLLAEPRARRAAAFVARMEEQPLLGVEPASPEVGGDGLLILGCNSLWSGADLAEWRTDHLPACATCLGTFGTGEQS